MTALISAMNKRAVALAADSAITIGDSSNHKVLNCANKLFNLSSAHSVGVMICGGASYMGLPWEVIIKEFGKSLGDTPLPNLNDYKEQFLSYLKNNNHFCKREWQIENLISELSRLYRINTNSSSPSASQEELKDSFIQKTDEITNDPIEDVEGLNGYPFEDFMMEFGSDIEPKAESFPLIKTYPELNEKFLRCFHKFLLRNNSLLGISKSQIVFTGYAARRLCRN